jgi:hypothetical protein
VEKMFGGSAKMSIHGNAHQTHEQPKMVLVVITVATTEYLLVITIYVHYAQISQKSGIRLKTKKFTQHKFQQAQAKKFGGFAKMDMNIKHQLLTVTQDMAVRIALVDIPLKDKAICKQSIRLLQKNGTIRETTV